MRKTLSLLLVLVLLLTPAGLGASAGASGGVPLRAEAAFDAESRTVTLQVLADEAVTLSNYDLSLAWDAAALTLTGAENGQTALFPNFLANAASGRVSAASEGRNVTVPAGEVLLRCSFAAADDAAGSQSISVTLRDAAEESGAPLSWKGQSLSVSVHLNEEAALPLRGEAACDAESRTVTLQVLAAEDVTLSNYDLSLAWDAAALRLRGAENGQAALFPNFLANAASGRVSAASEGRNVTVPAGEVLLRCTFAAIGAGSQSISVTLRDAAEESGSPLSWKGMGFSVTVDLGSAAPVPVTGVTLNKTSLSLTTGGSGALTATVLPADAADRRVAWVSGDPAVASVDEDGVVRAEAPGTAVITVTTAEGGYSAACTVTVAEPAPERKPVTGVRLDETALELYVNESAVLTATVLPEDADNRAVSWMTSDDSVVTVTRGTLTGKGEGSAVVTVITADGGLTAACTVTVKKQEAVLQSLELRGPDRTEVVEGTSLNLAGLEVLAVYNDGSRTAVTDYTVSGFRPTEPGTQRLTVSYGGLEAYLEITVVEKSLTGLSVTKRPDKVNYLVGEELDLTGLEVTAAYNNGTSERTEDYTVSGYDSSLPGSQTVVLRSGEYTAAFTVTVSRPGTTGDVAKPVLGLESFPGGKRVTLSSPDEGAEIYYTLDGSAPDAGSFSYVPGEPIVLSETATVKAVAVKAGVLSPVTSARITVSQVEAPVFHPAAGQVSQGTVVTLRSESAGVRIYYTEDGTEPLESESTRQYGGAIVIDRSKTIRAVAVKDGYRSSEIVGAAYTVPEAAQIRDSVTVSLGAVTGAAGDTVSVPLYLFPEDPEAEITDLRITVSYDNTQFTGDITVSPGEALEEGSLFSNVSVGSVTLLYSGTALEGGELCTLNLRSLASLPAGTVCELEVNLGSSRVETSKGESSLTALNAAVTLTEARLRELSGGFTLTTGSGETVESAEALGSAGEAELSITLEDAPEDAGTLVNVYLAIYNRRGALAGLESWEVEISAMGTAFMQNVRIPRDVEVGAVKILVLSDDMVPLMAAGGLR